MRTINEMEIKFKAISINEGFARSAIAAFCIQANPSVDEITDIKTAVSEAVTNAVVHAYPLKDGDITIRVKLYNTGVVIEISDNGIGIDDFDKAREPFYTTKPNEERSGMGFTVMESFMDSVSLQKNGKTGVLVKMEKIFKDNYSQTVAGV
ncbi:MAG: anti-sigma F factor [Clostridiales bacterium]|nr:anti-sigma F factor [Clostridiales bacterium]